MATKSRIDRKAFKRIYDRHLIPVDCLSFTDIGDVFGAEFYEMMLYALMDAGEAARVIQGCVNRLKAGEKVDEA